MRCGTLVVVVVVVVVVIIIMHAEAARDPIISTQRIREVKISMVGIDKVKVRFHSIALPHVSHFFQIASRGRTSNRRVLQSL